MKFSFSLVFVAIATITTFVHADNSVTARSLRTELAEDTSCNFVCFKSMLHVIRPPVLDENGKAYESECVMKREKCKEKEKAAKGKKVSPSDSGADDSTAQLDDFCPQYCLHVYDPVTDENGKTYSNECQMRRAKCKRKRKHGGNIGDVLEEYERIYGKPFGVTRRSNTEEGPVGK